MEEKPTRIDIATILEKTDEVIVVPTFSYVDASSTKRLEEVLTQIAERTGKNGKQIVLDLTNTKFLSSEPLRAVLAVERILMVNTAWNEEGETCDFEECFTRNSKLPLTIRVTEGSGPANTLKLIGFDTINGLVEMVPPKAIAA